MAVWSAVNLSDLGHAQRFEAEYYKPDYLVLDETLKRVCASPINRYLDYLTDGTHITPRYVSDGIPFLSSSDVDPFLLPDVIQKFISQTEHDGLRHCQPMAKDVLMSKSGRIGSCAVVPDDVSKGDWNIYEGIAILRLSEIDPHYAAAFLNSKFGLMQVKRELKGVAQPHLHLEDIRRLKIFVPDVFEQQAISDIVSAGVYRAKESYRLYSYGQEIMNAEMDLDTIRFKRPTGFTASFSELGSARRSDAQHYQPHYRALLAHIARFPSRQIHSIRTYNRRGVQPNYVQGGKYPVVNSQHLGPRQIAYAGLEQTSLAAFRASPEAHIQPNDLLIYTTGAYVGRTNVYLNDAPALASNHVSILRLVPGIDPAYMALVLQSPVGQLQTQQHARGSAQAELYPADIDKFVVPLLDPAIQRTIGDLVRDSLTKQRESARLLEQAKMRVEQFIEAAAA